MLWNATDDDFQPKSAALLDAGVQFAQKALAFGMPTIQVDGNDVFAVYKAHKQAVERARNGEGPSFIESITYRLGDHTTADDARSLKPERSKLRTGPSAVND